MKNSLISIFWIEDDKFLTEAVKPHLHKVSDKISISYYIIANKDDFFAKYNKETLNSYDIILIDNTLRTDIEGSELAIKLIDKGVNCKIYILSQHNPDPKNLGKLLNKGIQGWILKDDIVISGSIEENFLDLMLTLHREPKNKNSSFYLSNKVMKEYIVYLGRELPVFSRHELEIISLIGKGYTDKEISRIVYGRDERHNTVEHKILSMKRKFNDNYEEDITKLYGNDFRIQRSNLPLIAIALNLIKLNLDS